MWKVRIMALLSVYIVVAIYNNFMPPLTLLATYLLCSVFSYIYIYQGLDKFLHEVKRDIKYELRHGPLTSSFVSKDKRELFMLKSERGS